MAKKLVCILLVCVLALPLAACGASVSLFTGSSGDEYVHTLEIRIPARLYNEMEKTAAVIPNTYKRWTLPDWLNGTYLPNGQRQIGICDYSVYEYLGYVEDGVDFIAQLEYRFPIDDGSDDGEEDSDVVQTIKNYFFVYAIEVTQPNPFNGLRADYDDAAEGQNGSLMQIIKNGIGYYQQTEHGQEWVQLLPSLTQAFPAVKGYDPSELTLNLYLGGSSRMASTGTKVRMGGNTYYLWERKFDESEQTITLKYLRPNTLGWNITAIVVAGIVVVIILLATRGKKKKTDDLIDRYPYDPFNPDSGNRLPTDSSSDPFRY